MVVLNTQRFEFTGEPLAHSMDLWTIRRISGNTGNCYCRSKSIDKRCLQRVNSSSLKSIIYEGTCQRISSDKPLWMLMKLIQIEVSESGDVQLHKLALIGTARKIRDVLINVKATDWNLLCNIVVRGGHV